MLKKILIGLGVVVLGFLAFAATRPDTYHVERSVEITAPAEAVFAQISDFKAWAAWSPWEKLDPQMQKNYEGTPGAVGAAYSWQGNSDVGKGKMTVTELEAPRHLAIELEFIEPFASVASTQFKIEPAAGDAVKATWSMDGHNDFMGKVFSIFMDMDAMIGADYEKGLAALTTVSQDAAKQMAEAKARAEAEAAAKAAAAAAAANTAQPPAEPAPAKP